MAKRPLNQKTLHALWLRASWCRPVVFLHLLVVAAVVNVPAVTAKHTEAPLTLEGRMASVTQPGESWQAMLPGTWGPVLFAQAQWILESNQKPQSTSCSWWGKEGSAALPQQRQLGLLGFWSRLVNLLDLTCKLPKRKKEVQDRIRPRRQSKRITAIFWSSSCISGRCESLEVIKQHKSPGVLGFSNYSKHLFMTSVLSGQMNWIRGRYLTISKTSSCSSSSSPFVLPLLLLLSFNFLIVLHVIFVAAPNICWPVTSELSCHVSI